MKKRITIKDIAERAQVSRGTVDRVIHNRGNVALEIEEKILAVMEELSYERNIIASTLAYNRTFHIGVLLPNYEDDPYWDQPRRGIEMALKSVEHYGIQVSFFYFDQYDTQSFRQQARKLLEEKVDAILLAPVYFNESVAFLDNCERLGIPYIQINTSLPRDHACNLGYIGQDSYQTGVLAGRLLAMQAGSRRAMVILHVEESVANAHHLVEKERGFRDYFAERTDLAARVIQLSFPPFTEPEAVNQFLDENLLSIPGLAGIFVTTSRVYLVANHITQVAGHSLKLVGVDLIEKNIRLMLDEQIDFLINQNPLRQGYYAILSLAEYLVKKSKLEKTHNLPLDIVVKENYRYYLEATQELRTFV